MAAVGVGALVVVGVGALAGIAVAIRSLPDLARYRRLRKM